MYMSLSKPDDKRIQRSLHAMRSSFISLANTKLYSKITVEDIMEYAGYSRATFYNRFNCKDDFVKHLIEDEIQKYINVVSNYLIRVGNVVIDIKDFKITTILFELIYNERDFLKILLSDSYSEIEQYYYRGIAQKLCQILDIIFPAGIDINDTEFFFYTSIVSFFGCVKYWKNDNFKYSPSFMALQYNNQFLRDGTSVYFQKKSKKSKV